LKCLLICGASKEDPRVKKAVEWLAKNYTVSANPGNAAGAEMRGYYYYIATLAKCLDTMGVDEFVDAKGTKHNWRAEILSELATKQRKDGSFANSNTGFQEGNADLCTAFALIALSHARPKAK
jgi:squalene-hopene/tetraprenyl-beta-curcumene cyclase